METIIDMLLEKGLHVDTTTIRNYHPVCTHNTKIVISMDTGTVLLCKYERETSLDTDEKQTCRLIKKDKL